MLALRPTISKQALPAAVEHTPAWSRRSSLAPDWPRTVTGCRMLLETLEARRHAEAEASEAS